MIICNRCGEEFGDPDGEPGLFYGYCESCVKAILEDKNSIKKENGL